jgi:hypothetical protein
MTVDLTFAEEPVAVRTVTDVFAGQEYELVTGRVLLHAVTTGRALLCGRGQDDLTFLPTAWGAGYLPHVSRCRACAKAARTLLPDAQAPRYEASGGEVPPAVPAEQVEVRCRQGTAGELAGATALRAVLAEHDLRRWMFTDLVLIDGSVSGGVSHPLTITPDLLVSRPASALTTFMHEQLHWLESPGLNAAISVARERWPDPPLRPAGGAHDVESTWLHLVVCALEYQSLTELLGRQAATAELECHRGYSWIYYQILSDPRWFADFLAAHQLAVPAAPSVPRRYYGAEVWRELRSQPDGAAISRAGMTGATGASPGSRSGPDRTGSRLASRRRT